MMGSVHSLTQVTIYKHFFISASLISLLFSISITVNTNKTDIKNYTIIVFMLGK